MSTGCNAISEAGIDAGTVLLGQTAWASWLIATFASHTVLPSLYLLHSADYLLALSFVNVCHRADAAKFRRLVIELVLATDMKQHFSTLSHFAAVHKMAVAAGGGAFMSGSCNTSLR